jgi:aspartate/methionine/tyrosine aminotransferase
MDTVRKTPIDSAVVSRRIQECGFVPGLGSTREIKKLVDEIESETGTQFIRMEMGVPGLKPPQVGIEAEIEALRKGVPASYPNVEGLPQLKYEISRFVKNFTNIDVDPSHCLPTAGSLMGNFILFFLAGKIDKQKDTILFIEPSFSVHKQQVKVLGVKHEGFDIYDFRGEKLHDKLESYLKKGNISSILYSNPNNPTWICFTEEELKTIGELCTKYDVIPMEDMAYFAMDFRKDLSVPGQPPYQSTVARYTDKFIMFISSSKAFSYAGQRIGMLVVSDNLFDSKYPDLLKYYSTDSFGRALIFGTLFPLTAGIAQSPQYGLAAILKAVNDGEYNFVEQVREYGERAGIIKKLFTNNGFYIVYDKDNEEPIADGFYFTFNYPGFTGVQLTEELLYYGISGISLATTGSTKEGVRACVSFIQRHMFDELEKRLKQFHEDHRK